MELKNYTVSHRTGFGLEPISHRFPKTGLVLLLGSNGTGKTTLLRSFTEPEIFNIKGTCSEKPETFLFLNHGPINSKITVRKYLDLSYSINRHKDDPTEILRTLCEPLHEKLRTLFDKKLYELSSGQLQKVIFANAWVSPQKIVFLDEPTNFLDHDSKNSFLESLRLLRLQKLVWLATHEFDRLQGMTDSILVLKDRKAHFLNDLSDVKNILKGNSHE